MAKLTAHVKRRCSLLDCRGTVRRVIHRDASTVVLNGDGVVLVESNGDGVTVTTHELINRVIHDLPEQVVVATLIGAADVHTGAGANWRQSNQLRHIFSSVR